MKNAITMFKRFRPATIIAMLALLVAISGTATAASGLIDGKKIKPGTVTAKQIKEIAELKFNDLNAVDIEGAISVITGTARSMGITIEG